MVISGTIWFVGRVLVAASVVAAASLVAEAGGPVLGALAASLPVSAGPTYAFLALTKPAAFVSMSALASFAANAATMTFLSVYARSAAGRPRIAALGLATLAWIAAAAAVQLVAWTAWTALALNAGAFTGGVALTRSIQALPSPARQARTTGRELLGRALAVAVFVAGVLGLSAALGPRLTGALAAFPIVFLVLIFVLQPRIGDGASALLAVTALKAMGGFGLMLLTAHLAVPLLGAASGLVLALVPTLLWSAVLAIPFKKGPGSPAVKEPRQD